MPNSCKRSELWNYFIKVKEGGECQICHSLVKSLGTTTNLRKHMERRHPKVDLNIVEKISKTVEPKSPNAFQDLTPKGDPNENEENEGTAISESPLSTPSTSFSIRQRQPLIHAALSTVESFQTTGKKAEQITNAIVYMIAKDDLPLNTSEKEGFQHLLKTIVPLYKAPTKKTIASLVDKKYAVLSLIVEQKMSGISNLTLTTDVWTETMNTRGFLGVTCHFVKETKLHSITLGVKELSERHSSEYVGECLRDIMNEWNISVEKVNAIVTDNGSNIVKACHDIFGKNKHLACFAHTLDLVATKIIEDTTEVKNVIFNVKAIVKFSKQSVVVADELRKAQPQENVLKLCQSVPTRWNSTYYMLDRFTKLYGYIVPILLRNPKSPPMISASDMELITEVLKVLSPLEEVSKEMCGEKYLTASKIIPLVHCLKQNINGYKPVSEIGKNFKLCVLKEIDKRFGAIENNTILGIATMMDPRFKKLHFQQPLACSKIIEIINKLCRQEQTKKSPEKDNFKTGDTEKEGLWIFHETLAKKSRLDYEEVGGLNIDFKLYLNQPTTHLKSEPLDYWNIGVQNNALRELALKYLPIVGTSVPTERLFSKAGYIMSPSRNRLGGKRLSELLFLKSLDKGDWNI